MGTIIFLTFLTVAAIFSIAYLLYIIQKEISKFRKSSKGGTNIIANLLSYINKSIDNKETPFKLDDVFNLSIKDIDTNMDMASYSARNIWQVIDLDRFMEDLYMDNEVTDIRRIRSQRIVSIEDDDITNKDMKIMYKLTVGKNSIYFYINYPVYREVEVGKDEEGNPIWENRLTTRDIEVISDTNKDVKLKHKMIKYYVQQNLVTVKPPKNEVTITGIARNFSNLTLNKSPLINKHTLKRHFPIKEYPIHSIKIGTEEIEIPVEKRKEFYNDLKQLLYGEDTSNILIKGLPGSGKSSIITNILLDMAYREDLERDKGLTVVIDNDFTTVSEELRNDPSALSKILPASKVIYIIDNANEIMNDKKSADMLASIMDGPNALPNVQFVLLINDNLDNVREDLSRIGRINLTINLKNSLTIEETLSIAKHIEENLPDTLYMDMNKLQYMPEPRKFSDIFSFIRLKEGSKDNPFKKYV